ncbi:MAG: phosphoglucosamine mutase [Kosmotoga sp.]|nr:MAG: phosphoglucosamine mutase [Kosmotoga sp.]
MKKLFGTDGLRGTINEELTPELAMKVGNAVSRLYAGKYKKLLIAKDTRSSGDLLESALSSGAASAGMDVDLVGVLSTPALAYLTRKHNYIGAMISASHNPAVYNGIKVIEKGKKATDDDEVEIENLMAEQPLHYALHSSVGKIRYAPFYRDEYLEYVLELYKDKPLFEGKLALDGANGAIVAVIEDVLNSLNIKADLHFIEPNGVNINDNCGSLHPEAIGNRLYNDEIGVLFDGDADRCLFVLPKSKVVNGDMLMALNAKKLQSEGRLMGNLVVSTVMSNLGFEKYLEKLNIKLLRTKVGDKYVLSKMIEINSNLGGEQSGHIIFMDRNSTGDGLITTLETLNTLATESKTLSDFYNNFPVFPQTLKNVPIPNKKEAMECEKLKKILEKLNKEKDLRVVVRPSGTEPYVRVMVEGIDEETVNNVSSELVEVVEDCANA